MKDWKTTITGCIAAAGYAGLAYLEHGGVSPKEAMIVAGLAALGVLGKDSNLFGENVTPTIPTKEQ